MLAGVDWSLQTRHLIFDDISARTQQTDLSVPGHASHTTASGEQGWWYYSRTVEGSDYPIRCRVRDTTGRRPDLSGAVDGEQVLLDGNAEAEGHDFFELGAFSVSPDGSLLAWSVDHAGDERYTLFVRDLATGEDWGPVLTQIAPGIAWAGGRCWAFSSWGRSRQRRRSSGPVCSAACAQGTTGCAGARSARSRPPTGRSASPGRRTSR